MVPGGTAMAPDEMVRFRVRDETQTVVMEGS
jgi:hypothetical protein